MVKQKERGIVRSKLRVRSYIEGFVWFLFKSFNVWSLLLVDWGRSRYSKLPMAILAAKSRLNCYIIIHNKMSAVDMYGWWGGVAGWVRCSKCSQSAGGGVGD